MTNFAPPAPDSATRQAAITDLQRLAALRGTALLDTPPEESFDRLTRLATDIIGAPASFMTLVDATRDFYKSMSGPGEPLVSTRQWVGPTFCQFLLTSGGPLVLDDVTAYPGYRDLDTIRTLGLRAYAGVPLTTSEGQCLGSFCAVDFSPRRWRDLDVKLLTELAQSAMREIELRQALLRAYESVKAKSMFLSNMSHEIRTPMNAILGYTQLMSRDSQDPKLRDRLSMVDTAAKHLLQVLNDVLDMSKAEAGKMQLENAPFVLGDLLSSCLNFVRPRADEKGLELVLDCGDLPHSVLGDITRLRQALLNLLTNAVKFTQRGQVRLSVQLLSQNTNQVQLRFEVSDSGEGIAESAQARLFNCFEQADPSVSRRHGGTGLGLTLTRQLAQLMGGSVGMHSVLGEGSRFWLTAYLGRVGAINNRPSS
jgi:signal transduction histidine kinase